MSKVSITMGVNVPLSKGAKFERFTPSVTISDIDTDLDVEEQLKISIVTASQVWEKVSDYLEEHVDFETMSEITLPLKK